MPNTLMNLAHEEFLQTEKQYLDDLHALVQLSKALPKLGAVDSDASSVIFINVGEILEVNQMFASDCMDDGCSVEQLCRSFIASADNMIKVYRPYLARHLDALEQLEKSVINPEFNRIVKAFLQTLGRQSIKNLLIKPVQRVCKYPLLFQQVINYNENPTLLPFLLRALESSNRVCEELETPAVSSPRRDRMVTRLFEEAALTRSTGHVQTLPKPYPAAVKLGGSVALTVGTAPGVTSESRFEIPSLRRMGNSKEMPTEAQSSPHIRSRSSSMSSSLEGSLSGALVSGGSLVLPMLGEAERRKDSVPTPPRLVLTKSKTTPNIKPISASTSPMTSPPSVVVSPVVSKKETRRARREFLIRELERLNGETTRVLKELHNICS